MQQSQKRSWLQLINTSVDNAKIKMMQGSSQLTDWAGRLTTQSLEGAYLMTSQMWPALRSKLFHGNIKKMLQQLNIISNKEYYQ